jgi:hypothetical protein
MVNIQCRYVPNFECGVDGKVDPDFKCIKNWAKYLIFYGNVESCMHAFEFVWK